MNLPFLFARRYIFSKKSTSAINIISMISVFGITLGCTALIVILSVFNGFEDLLRELMGGFKPDILVTPKEGKVFQADSSKTVRLAEIEGVLAISQTLEEIALFEYNEAQNLGAIKGVDENFLAVTALDTTLRDGAFLTEDKDRDLSLAVAGAGLEYTLNIMLNDIQNRPILVYMPKRKKKNLSATTQPFKKKNLYPIGIYSVKDPVYDKYLITNLAFVQNLLSYKDGEISAIEIKLDETAEETKIIEAITAIMGDDFNVKNRYQQDEAFFKITNMEKWVGFLIFAFTLVLVAFNMVGALWMLVLEKKQDIASLKAMGATNAMIRNIFLMEGFLLSFIGGLVGCVLAVILCILQQEYGLVSLEGGGFIIDRYPVAMRFSDFVLVMLTVVGIGVLAALLPAMRAARVTGLVRKD